MIDFLANEECMPSKKVCLQCEVNWVALSVNADNLNLNIIMITCRHFSLSLIIRNACFVNDRGVNDKCDELRSQHQQCCGKLQFRDYTYIINSVYIAPVRKCRQMLFMLHNDVPSAVPFRRMHQMIAELPSLLAFYFIMYFLRVDQDDDVKA